MKIPADIGMVSEDRPEPTGPGTPVIEFTRTFASI